MAVRGLATALGVLLVAGAVSGLLFARRDADVGTPPLPAPVPPAVAATNGAARTAPGGTAPGGIVTTPTPGAPEITAPTQAPSPPTPAQAESAAAPPARLVIPSIDLDVPIVEVGVADDGQMEVPTDVHTVGWYRFGPAPGQAGSAVLAGHVDSRTQGRGSFFRLVALAVGDRASVVDRSGASRAFRVVARRAIDKAELPTDELFARTGDPRLVLVTCGGRFDASVRQYRQNVVVWLTPVAA